MKIKIPRHCETSKTQCHFSMWTGNMQENYCGLYQKFTCNDHQDLYPKKTKPEFCKAKTVEVIELAMDTLNQINMD